MNPCFRSPSCSPHSCEMLSCTMPSAEICGTTVIVSDDDPGVEMWTIAGSLFSVVTSGAQRS